MEAVFIFTGIVILLVAVGIGILLSQVLERGEQKRKVDEDPCEKCLRWPECNGVDEACPVRWMDGRILKTAIRFRSR